MRNLMTRTALGLCGASLLLAAPMTIAQPLQEIRISSQPALLGSIPFRVADEMGWWEEMGLTVTLTNFPAGAPQIAASRSWDVGYTGSVPAVLGALRFDLHTIALSDDQSATNALMVSDSLAESAEADPSSLAGQTVFLTANSTVDLAARACLRSFGLEPDDVIVRSMGQAEIISAMASGAANLGGLWAPNTYTVEESAGARMLCSGKDAGVLVPGNMVVRAEFGAENPELVARFLAVYLRAQRWLASDRAAALEMMEAHYEDGGVRISEPAMNQEFDLRPMFSLDEQLALMDRSSGASAVDTSMTTIAEFIQSVGTIETVPEPETYIIDDYLRIIAEDPELRAFANYEN